MADGKANIQIRVAGIRQRGPLGIYRHPWERVFV